MRCQMLHKLLLSIAICCFVVQQSLGFRWSRISTGITFRRTSPLHMLAVSDSSLSIASFKKRFVRERDTARTFQEQFEDQQGRWMYRVEVFLCNCILRTVTIGKVKLGSDHPVARQTMTTTNTRDVNGTVEQVTF